MRACVLTALCLFPLVSAVRYGLRLILGSLWASEPRFAEEMSSKGPIDWSIILSKKLAPLLVPTGPPSLTFNISGGDDPIFRCIESGDSISLSDFRELIKRAADELEAAGTRLLCESFLQHYGNIQDFANSMKQGKNKWGFEADDHGKFLEAIHNAGELNEAAVTDFQESLLFFLHLSMAMAGRASEVVCLCAQTAIGKLRERITPDF